jgi:dCMP deaminase
MRPDLDTYFMSMAILVASRATCPRRKVGSVLINTRGHVLATGYNGVAAGQTHCIDSPCPGAGLPSGQGLDKCQALHGEQNALLQCRDVYQIDTAYVTASPCITCTKLFLNTSCRRIVFLDEYPHSDAKDLWVASGRDWVQFTRNELLLVQPT